MPIECRVKGKIERLNRMVEQQLLRGLPGFTGGARDARGRLVLASEPHTAERRGERFRRVVYEPRSVGRSLPERSCSRVLVATVSLRF